MRLNTTPLARTLDTKADHRDPPRMSEEEPNALSTGGAPPAKGSLGAASGGSAAPAAPVNKVHEWAAAAVIVVLLSLILVGFVYFLRGTSI